MITENGLIVENADPIEPARKIAAMTVMASYPNDMKIGARIG